MAGVRWASSLDSAEDVEVTYYPDNFPVEVKTSENSVQLISLPEILDRN